jgi:hypothetical protein
MTNTRDNFSKQAVRALAGRVGFRCSFPGCGLMTIGPKTKSVEETVLVGEACHIQAASPGGPRFDPLMTPEERRSISNGIWLCRQHARLIDADEGNYSAETLHQWKSAAEAGTYKGLSELIKTGIPKANTLICLNPQLIFEGIWTGATDDIWRFTVKKFIYGDQKALREFQVAGKGQRKDFIIIESQGDGRMIHNEFEWKQLDDNIEFSVRVFPSVIRRNPEHIGSGPAMGEKMLENGRMRMISGKELAIQKIGFLLNTNQGATFMNRGYGSLFNFYYQEHNHNRALLNRLIKVELTRLITIPTNPEQPAGQPELNFINRIYEVRIGLGDKNTVPVWISLEWGDGSSWEGDFIVHVDGNASKQINTSLQPVKFITVNPEPNPRVQLKALTAAMTGDELTIKKNEASVLEIFKSVLPAIMDKATEYLSTEVFTLFDHHKFYRTFDHSTFEYNTSYDLEAHLLKRGLIYELAITLQLKGFKKAGIKAFDIASDLFFYFNDYNFMVGISQSNPWLTKLYDQMPSPDEVQMVANSFIDHVLKQVNEKIQAIS